MLMMEVDNVMWGKPRLLTRDGLRDVLRQTIHGVKLVECPRYNIRDCDAEW